MARSKEAEAERCRKKAIKAFYDRKQANLCVGCGKCPPDGSCVKCLKCKKAHQQINVSERTRIKAEVFSRYGGAVCACCGETNFCFLQLDHVNSGGYKHRQEIGGGSNIFRWLKKNNYPAGYQILCANCNWGKHINGGVCPHKATPFLITETDYNYE